MEQTHEVRDLEAGLLNNLATYPSSVPPGHRYSSVAALLLQHGRFFSPPLTPGAPGEPRACYRNAHLRADERDGDLTYVEGVALSADLPAIVADHAWCVDGRGMVVDPTWTAGICYFGVPLTDEWRRHRLVKTGQWCILQDRDLLVDGLPKGVIVSFPT